MKKINYKKYFTVFFILAILLPVGLSFQNFKRIETPLAIEKDSTSMNDALIQALQKAEAEKKEKQVALNVDENPYEKSVAKKDRKPTNVGESTDSFIGDDPIDTSALPSPIE